jgi:hypothetical protein|tara:strand:+ start:845 stop:1099 length:255 start_codon:yes stop_codon:yes gene_type:complete
MKKFLINIYAYDHHARFKLESNDDAVSLEKAIVDKLGENSITWESSGMFRDIPYRITYEEVSNDTRPLQTKKVLGVEVGTGVAI